MEPIEGRRRGRIARQRARPGSGRVIRALAASDATGVAIAPAPSRCRDQRRLGEPIARLGAPRTRGEQRLSFAPAGVGDLERPPERVPLIRGARPELRLGTTRGTCRLGPREGHAARELRAVTSRYVNGPAVSCNELGGRRLGAPRCGLGFRPGGAAGGLARRGPPRPAPALGRASPSTTRTHTARPARQGRRAHTRRHRPDGPTTTRTPTNDRVCRHLRVRGALRLVHGRRLASTCARDDERREEVEPHVERGSQALVLGEDRERRRPVTDLEVVPGPDDLDIRHPDPEVGGQRSRLVVDARRADGVAAALVDPRREREDQADGRSVAGASRELQRPFRLRLAFRLASDRGQGAGDPDARDGLGGGVADEQRDLERAFGGDQRLRPSLRRAELAGDRRCRAGEQGGWWRSGEEDAGLCRRREGLLVVERAVVREVEQHTRPARPAAHPLAARRPPLDGGRGCARRRRQTRLPERRGRSA